MGIYVGVGSKARALSKLYVGVGGKARQVQKVYVGVSGKARLVYQYGAPISSKAVGSIVKIKVSGAAREFIIVHQGLPSGDYDSSCNGTWLLQRYLYDDVSFDGSLYESSSIHAYMNNTFFPKVDASMQSLVKSVKIPFRDNKGANGLSTRAFALAACEIGQHISDNDSGAVLKYFSNGNSPVARNTSGTSLNWWTRSRYKGLFGSNDNWYVDTSGDIVRGSSGRSEKARPCVIVSSTALLDDAGNFIT